MVSIYSGCLNEIALYIGNIASPYAQFRVVGALASVGTKSYLQEDTVKAASDTSSTRIERPDPNLTLNGVIKVLAATSAIERENILRDFKFPDPEGKAQSHYYQPARDLIRRYHESGNDLTVFQEGLRVLEASYAGTTYHGQLKIENNIRVVRAYQGYFGKRKFEPLTHQPVSLTVEGVLLSLRPDMLAKEKSRLCVLRYAFGKDGASTGEMRYSPQMLHFYARQAKLDVANSDCQLLVVADGTSKRCTGVMSRFEARLRGEMRVVKALWPMIE